MDTNLQRIEIRKRHFIPNGVLNAIMVSQNYTEKKAKLWLKHFIFDSIKEEIEFYDDIPYRNKTTDYEYVKKQLSRTGVDDAMIDKFFNKNFQYAEAETPKNAEWKPATTITHKAQHLARDIKEVDGVLSVKKLVTNE